MHSGDGGTGEGYRSTTVGFGRLAYDPINKTFWYYGYGQNLDQGGVYPGPTNFGTGSLDGFIELLKRNIEFALPEIERLTMERVNEGNDKGPV